MNAETTFRAKAPGIMARLRGDFPFNVHDAAAVLGNLGHESNGFTALQETRPTVKGSRGGWGWAQWTGPRRRAFEAYCKRNKLDPASDQANYAYLFVELHGSEKRAVPRTMTAVGLERKVIAFEQAFLRAGIKHYDSRLIWARAARDAFVAAGLPAGGTPATEQAVVLRDEAEASGKRANQSVAAASGSAAASVGGAALAANHAGDWLLLGGFAGLVLIAAALLAVRAFRENRRAAALAEAADQIEVK